MSNQLTIDLLPHGASGAWTRGDPASCRSTI